VIRRHLLAAGLALALPLAALAAPANVAGVKYEDTAQVGGTKLLLNGSGLRLKAIFKVYTAALYLPAKATTPEAVIAQPGPKRMHIVMLREINAAELGKLFARGMEDNAPRDEFSKSVAGVLQMSDIFFQYKKLAAGDYFTADWVPGTGTVISVNGKQAGQPIKEPEFYSALLKIWLGKSPADTLLKEGLLGRTE
jgi:hypothetical protein